MRYTFYSAIKNRINNPYLIIVFALTCIGFLFRIYNLGHDPFWVDEVISVLAAHGLLQHGVPLLPSGELYPRDLLSTYTIATSIQLFGVGEFAARLPSVILGTLTIPLTYFLGKKVAGNDVGLIAAFFITFSFFEIGWSRQARMYQMYQFFFLFAITAYAYFKVDHKLRYASLLIMGIIGTYFTHVTWKILPPIILIDILFTTRIKNNITNAIRYVIVVAAIIFVAAVIIYKHPIFPSWIYGIFTEEVTEIVYWNYPSDFLKEMYTSLWWFAILGGLILPLKNWKNGTIVVFSFWISLFTLSYYGNALGIGGWWPRYMYFTIPFFFLLSAVGIWAISSKIAESVIDEVSSKKYIYFNNIKLTKRVVSILVVVGILIIIVLTPAIPDIGLKLNGTSQLDEPQPNYRDAAKLIKTNLKEQDIIISNRPQLVYYYLGRVDYRGNSEFTVDKDGRKIDWYTGASVIENDEHLKQIISENSRGWIIFNPFMKLVGKNWIEQNLDLYGTVLSTLDDQIVYIYTWGIVPKPTILAYSDDFDTDKWSSDTESSNGIDRSKGIIHTKYILYPIVMDSQSYVKYHLNFSNTPNRSTIIATGNRRHIEHNLSVWASADNKTYTKIIDFEEPKDTIKQADITSYIKDNQTWIEFRFFRSSKGDNMPRILDFSITADSKNNQTIEITPFGKDKDKLPGTILNYNPTNLLSEPSFEHYKDSTNPPIVWSFTSSNSGIPYIDNTGFDGNYSYRVSVQNTREGVADMSQLFDINENEYYRLNATHKQSGSGNATILVQWFGGDWKLIREDKLDLEAANQWNTSSIEKISPLNTKHGKVILRYQTKAGDSGMVWFDDIKLQTAIKNSRD